MNSELVSATGNPYEVSFTNLIVGVTLASVVVLSSKTLRGSWRLLIAAIRQGSLRPWELIGGLLGGCYIAVQGSAALAVGVAIFTIAVVAGQTTGALVVDRLGLGPAGRKDVTLNRLCSAGLAILAIVISAWGRVNDPGTSMLSTLVIVILAVLAGAGGALQQAVNGRVSAATGRSIVAAWLNFAVGSAFMIILVLTLGLIYDGPPQALQSEHWWLYLAGVFGLMYIATVAWVVRIVGVLMSSLLTLAGLLAGSLVSEYLNPTRGTSINAGLFCGIALVILATLIAGARPTQR